MAERPNILVVLTDQQRHDTLPARLDRFKCTTPALDALVRRAATFSHAFAANPICAPARAAIMTGRHPSALGVPCNLSQPLREDLPTIGRRLQLAGYETVYHGKSHLKGDLRNLGFEVAYENSHDPSTVQEASRFWRNRDWMNHQRPFFHVVSLLNPHDIYFLDPEQEDEPTPSPWPNAAADDAGRPVLQRYAPGRKDWSDGRWAYYRRFYRERVEKVDACVGVLMEELTCSGFASNTWVLFTSDHGDLAGEHGRPFKGVCLSDASLRIPLVVAPPDLRRLGRNNRDGSERAVGFAPRVADVLASQVDLLPTILDVAGLPADSRLPGRSLLPAVRGEPMSDPEDGIFAEVTANATSEPALRAIRTRQWKYVLASGGEEELYDVAVDPWEIRNLAGHPEGAAVRADLRARLLRHLEREGDVFTRFVRAG